MKLPGQTILQLVLAKRAIQQSKVPHTKTDISGHPMGSPAATQKNGAYPEGEAPDFTRDQKLAEVASQQTLESLAVASLVAAIS